MYYNKGHIGLWTRCADLAANSADRSHYFNSDPSRTSSPLQVFGTYYPRFFIGLIALRTLNSFLHFFKSEAPEIA
jgi:hypothetical protein